MMWSTNCSTGACIARQPTRSWAAKRPPQLDTERVGGTWQGPVFVLTHHPEDAQPADGVTFLSSDVAGAVRIGLEAAGGKNLEVFSPTIGRQLVERGLIDEIDLHIAPVFGSANQLRGEFLG